MAAGGVFSDEELEQLKSFPEINRVELIRYFTLPPADESFVNARHSPGHRLGVAAQLCTLPWLGFVPDDVTAAPAAAVARLSERLGIPIGELRSYGVREQTRTEHLREAAQYLSWRHADDLEWKDLEEFLFARAMEHNSPKLLFQLGCEYLASKVIRPGPQHLLKRVTAARTRAKAETWLRVAASGDPDTARRAGAAAG